jgi:hypothetical protein
MIPVPHVPPLRLFLLLIDMIAYPFRAEEERERERERETKFNPYIPRRYLKIGSANSSKVQKCCSGIRTLVE